jgi:hypothetical protein
VAQHRSGSRWIPWRTEETWLEAGVRRSRPWSTLDGMDMIDGHDRPWSRDLRG